MSLINLALLKVIHCIITEYTKWIIDLYKHEEREILEKDGPYMGASCTFQVFLKIPNCLIYNSTMRNNKFF